jgi:hypothetical protein
MLRSALTIEPSLFSLNFTLTFPFPTRIASLGSAVPAVSSIAPPAQGNSVSKSRAKRMRVLFEVPVSTCLDSFDPAGKVENKELELGLGGGDLGAGDTIEPGLLPARLCRLWRTRSFIFSTFCLASSRALGEVGDAEDDGLEAAAASALKADGAVDDALSTPNDELDEGTSAGVARRATEAAAAGGAAGAAAAAGAAVVTMSSSIACSVDPWEATGIASLHSSSGETA